MAVNKADYYDERDKRNLTVKTTTPSPVKTTTANKAVTYNGTATTPVKTNTPSVNKPATLSKILADNPNPSVNVKPVSATNTESKPTTPNKTSATSYNVSSYPTYNQGIVGTTGTGNTATPSPVVISTPTMTQDLLGGLGLTNALPTVTPAASQTTAKPNKADAYEARDTKNLQSAATNAIIDTATKAATQAVAQMLTGQNTPLLQTAGAGLNAGADAYKAGSASQPATVGNAGGNTAGNTGGNNAGNTSGGTKGTTGSGTSSSVSSATNVNVTQPAVPALDPVSDKAYKDALAALADINGKAPTYANSYEQQLNALLGNAPVYANSYEQQLNDLYGQIANRDPFSYDVNADNLYRQYAQIYANNGRLAMQDTMGQAAGLTGGYGSSYGQAVGQQQYDRYMQDLNGIIPELYDRAYNVWQDEGNQLIDQYGVLDRLASDEYNKYQDEYGRWQDDVNNVYRQAEDEYQKYLDAYGQWQDQRDFAAKQANNEYDKYQNDLANYNKQLAEQQSTSRSSGGSGGSTKKTSTSNNPGYTADQIKALQKSAGLNQTGVWDADTEKAYNNGYRADGKNVGDNAAVPSFKTYSEAVAYMNSKGVNNGKASGIMTESEWNRRKNAGASSASTSNYATYQDYLKDIVQYNLENK